MQTTEKFRNVLRSLVFKCHRKFSKGETDSASPGRPAYKDSTVQTTVLNVINNDRRQTVRDVAEKAECSKSTVQRILKTDLNMSHVSARWVPRLLTDEEKINHIHASVDFLDSARKDAPFMERTITTDEIWVHFYEPEDKRSSMMWKMHDSPPPKKAKTVKSVGKLMDMSGILLVHMVKDRRTVNSEYYSKVIRRDLLNSVRKKRPQLYANQDNIIIHQDNAPSHTAENTELDIDVLGFQKSYLRGKRFQNREEIKYALRSFNRSIN